MIKNNFHPNVFLKLSKHLQYVEIKIVWFFPFSLLENHKNVPVPWWALSQNLCDINKTCYSTVLEGEAFAHKSFTKRWGDLRSLFEIYFKLKINKSKFWNKKN